MIKVSESLKEILPDAVLEAFDNGLQEAIVIAPGRLHAVTVALKKDLRFDMLLDIIGIDWLDKHRPARFEVDYLFYGVAEKKRVQLKVFVADDVKPELDSLTDLYPIANWCEREVFDMFGIGFKNHPKLERLLMWDNFEGHPLRKDYPLAKRQPIPIAKDLL